MNISEYCGIMEFSILQFVFSTTADIHEKIKQKRLFYKEQIIRYVQKQIDLFFKQHRFKKAILHVYKYEVYNTIMFKLKSTLKENRIFQCV
jgi:hypothetical protein